ncbi:MAG: hypothetical protein L6R48_05695 [Planctomycetes bacterium]|nr:hypothetical protein [Planctomycetota bacterium]
MTLPPLLRRPGVAIGLILALVGLSVWINWPRPPALHLPRLDSQALVALGSTTDDRHQLLVHMSALLYRSDGRFACWKELPETARPLWTTLNLEAELERGSGVLRLPAQEGASTPADAADGYEAMGAAALAAVLRDMVPGLSDPGRPPPAALRTAFERRWCEMLPKAQAARLAWIRAHADEIARPH